MATTNNVPSACGIYTRLLSLPRIYTYLVTKLSECMLYVFCSILKKTCANKLWLNGYLALVKDSFIDFIIDNDGNEHSCPFCIV